MPFANIAVLKATDSSFVKGAVTDENGEFTVRQLIPGNYLLRTAYLGYGSLILPFAAAGSNKDIYLGTIKLFRESVMVEGAEIKAERPVYQFSGDKKIYNVAEDVSVQSGVASDALQNAPGVWVDMEGNITLRGVSGVEIWINGKPSRLDAEGLKSYLQQLPASALDRIEVITNPSAKYEASGTAGIINIVTRDKIRRNYFLSIGINGNNRPNVRPWISYFSGNERFRFSAFVSYSYSDFSSRFLSESAVLGQGDTLYKLNSAGKNSSLNRWAYAYLSGEYMWKKRNSLEVFAGISPSSNSNNYENLTYRSDFQSLTSYDILYFTSGSTGSTNWNGGLSYNRKFNNEGHRLDAYFRLSGTTKTSFNDYERIYSAEGPADKKFRGNQDAGSARIQFNLEYSNPFNDSTGMEAGINLAADSGYFFSPTDTFNFFTGEYLHAAYLSNHYSDYSGRADAYGSFNFRWKKIDVKLGMRAEYRNFGLTSRAVSVKTDQSFLSFFPSAFLSYRFRGTHNISLNYSRRVDYPQGRMDPFINYSSEENIQSGNPDLKPAYTHALETGYANYFKKGGSAGISLYYRYTNGNINMVTLPVFDTLLGRNTLYSRDENSGTDENAGAEISVSLKPATWARIAFSGNARYSHIRADMGAFYTNKERFSWDLRLTHNFTIKKLVVFQLIAVYRAPRLNLQGEDKPVYFINAHVRADFFRRRLSANLGVQDIFDWQKGRSLIVTPTYYSFTDRKSVTRFITFGLTLRLGKIEMEKQISTDGGGDEN